MMSTRMATTNPDGALNLITLNHGDKVEFYYAVGIADPADLTAVQGLRHSRGQDSRFNHGRAV